MATSIDAKVQAVAAALGSPLEPAAAAAIGAWIAQVEAWNRRVDLTAARSQDELVDLMLADALVLARELGRGLSVIDVGTGAGAPGLPLAIARPDLRLTLVEPLQKRVALLRTAIGALGPASPSPPPRVVRGRGEDRVGAGDRFDAAISRATLPPPAWLELGAALAPRGEVWVLLAQGEPPSRAGWSVAADLRYRWPLTGAERRAVRVVPSGASDRESA